MENQQDINNAALEFDFQPASDNHSIIKVVGVGGGGSNAVQHMYEAGIQDVSFLIINTDRQALRGSAIPNKLLISEKGLGAGAKPEVAHDFAIQYSDAIRHALTDGTEMVFITAGMGGGTGTGAAPVVAQIAHEMGILTVGIVTIPFRFEGKRKIQMALEGVRAIEKWCDALLVVNNNRLVDIYPDLTFGNAFGKADDTLTTAAKSISDIINVQGYINLDFADVSTTLRGGGVALISTGVADGEARLSKAIKAATTSPLLQDNKITDAKHLLFELCFSHQNAITMAEIEEMNEFVDGLNTEIEVIWGAMYDDDLKDSVRIILLASGFAMDHSTGGVMARDKMGNRTKEMQQMLQRVVDEKRGLLNEFDDCEEAAEIYQMALLRAEEKINTLSLDDSVDEETAKLEKALNEARDKKREVIDAKAEAARKEAEEAEALRQATIREQIAALTAQLNSNAIPFPAANNAPVAPAPANNAAPAPALATDKKKDDTVKKPSDNTPTAPVPAEPAVKKPHPVTADKEDTVAAGLEEIERFYGEETAQKMKLSDTRKAYFILDDPDLTNEELIRRLEHLPAYNRTLEDLGQLRAVNRQPAQPRIIGGMTV